MSAAHASKLPVSENRFLGTIQSSGAVSHSPANAADLPDMSPSTQRAVYLSLLAGVVFLAGVAAYVWYGFFQWQSLP